MLICLQIPMIAALVYVSLLMISSVRSIDWDAFRMSVPAFQTQRIMPFAYNIF